MKTQTDNRTQAVKDFEKYISDMDYEATKSDVLTRGNYRMKAVYTFRKFARSKYMPHQGERECARRATS